jgi:hypothetical protein
MIVRPAADRIWLITQPDHAHLARTIMEHCVLLAAHARRGLVLHAIAEHDNGWTEEDAAPTVDGSSGEIIDFVHAPASVRHGVWTRGVERLADEPWAAALVAQHAIVIYQRFRSDAAWTSFFAEMEAARGALLERAGLALDDLLDDYRFVRLADLISLAFCTGWTEEQSFGGWSVRGAGARIVVTPDLFDVATIPVEIAATEIPHQPFESDSQLRAALRDAKITTLRGTIVTDG